MNVLVTGRRRATRRRRSPGTASSQVNMELNAMKKIVLTSLFAIGLSSAALAQAATDFASVDTDANGSISLEEAQVAWPDLTEEAYKAADTDGNGELSVEEYDALVAASTAPAQ